MSGRVLVVGSLNQDLRLSVPHHPTSGETVLAGPIERAFGGKGANQAIAAVRAGAPVSMIGVVGDDEPGNSYLARLSTYGVDTGSVCVHPDRPTGTAVICVDEAGENVIIISPGANDQLGVDDLAVLESVSTGDVMLFSLEVPVPVVVEATRIAADRGARVVGNLAPYADLPAAVLDRCDPVVVNESEHAALLAVGLRPRSLLVTSGAEGSTWGEVMVPAESTEVVETTGAGDAYVGTLAARLALGDEPEQAMRAATAAAAECVRHGGAQPL